MKSKWINFLWNGILKFFEKYPQHIYRIDLCFRMCVSFILPADLTPTITSATEWTKLNFSSWLKLYIRPYTQRFNRFKHDAFDLFARKSKNAILWIASKMRIGYTLFNWHWETTTDRINIRRMQVQKRITFIAIYLVHWLWPCRNHCQMARSSMHLVRPIKHNQKWQCRWALEAKVDDELVYSNVQMERNGKRLSISYQIQASKRLPHWIDKIQSSNGGTRQ